MIKVENGFCCLDIDAFGFKQGNVILLPSAIMSRSIIVGSYVQHQIELWPSVILSNIGSFFQGRLPRWLLPKNGVGLTDLDDGGWKKRLIGRDWMMSLYLRNTH